MTDYDEHADAYGAWTAGDSPYWLLEQTRFFEVLGPITGMNILELACGEGRISRELMARGARSVRATDISHEMIGRAEDANRQADGTAVHPGLTFDVLDATDSGFQLETPADRVVAMYLFHYASSLADLGAMAELIARNLAPGGRFVAYTINPAYDLSREDPRLAQHFGFAYRPVDPPHYELLFGTDPVNMWQWSESQHRAALEDAGMTDVCWYTPVLPEDRQSLARSLQWYMEDPSCVVVSATKR